MDTAFLSLLVACQATLHGPSRMDIQLIEQPDALTHDDIACWNRLANTSMLRWEWMGSWYKAFEDEYQLMVLKVSEANRSVGFVPWCRRKRFGGGETICFLGSGKASSDHLTFLLEPERRLAASQAVAQWLLSPTSPAPTAPARLNWDCIEIEGVDAHDETMCCFVAECQRLGMGIQKRSGEPCYAIDLPKTLEDYVKQRSKSGRREIRKGLKLIDEGEVLIHHVTPDSFDDYWSVLVDLHEARRASLGGTGCFADSRFEQFLRQATKQLMLAGKVSFQVAIAKDKPIAVELSLLDENAVRLYQSGMDPEFQQLRPGAAILANLIRRSIETGLDEVDMLRGSEPYKERWLGKPTETLSLRLFHPKKSAKVRQAIFQVGSTLKSILPSNSAAH